MAELPQQLPKPVTPQQIAKRVQEGADARFGDVIERLLSILENPPPIADTQKLVRKWHQTGLLDGLPDFVQATLAEWLEDAAHKLIDWSCLENPDPKVFEDKCSETLFGLRDKAKFEYDRIETAVRRAKTEGQPLDHYLSLYHTHGFR